MNTGFLTKNAKPRHGIFLLQARKTINIEVLSSVFKRRYGKPPNTPGRGGKGSGVASGKLPGDGISTFGSAQEEAYFHMKQREELERIKKELKENPELTLNKKKDK